MQEASRPHPRQLASKQAFYVGILGTPQRSIEEPTPRGTSSCVTFTQRITRHAERRDRGAIGKKAGVVVDSYPRSGEPKKFATAHKLRRAFGLRWAHKVPAATLMDLMHHESIATTKKFYVGENTDVTAEVLWNVAGAGPGPSLGPAELAEAKI